ncbi:uncharacterized protein LOC110676923 [Aedes aegypti]|uniref:Uncharacterized protein n=1 Tax=Aedes aegypti TaxID=7159 RepID=A0A6I8U047_AEDAE|nr:uncharacterized protein LOC110676923 [Aedes aegypti]
MFRCHLNLTNFLCKMCASYLYHSPYSKCIALYRQYIIIILYRTNIFDQFFLGHHLKHFSNMIKLLSCLLLALIFSTAYSTTYTKSQVREIFAAGKECMRSLNIPMTSDIIERVLYNRDVVKDEETLKYFDCGCKKLGWVDNEGNVLMSPMVEFFSRNVPRKAVEEVLEKCKTFFDGANVGEKMFNFHQCFFEQKKF